jgi:uncharacterized repeat protein (TIGR03803 family)
MRKASWVIFLAVLATAGCNNSNGVAPTPDSAHVMAPGAGISAPASSRVHPHFGSYSILHTFSESGESAIFPSGTLWIKSNGNIFGTTTVYSVTGSACGCGAVYKLTYPTYAESVVYFFNGGSDGYLPETGVIGTSGGTLYGTTYGGGKQGGVCAPYGCGTVFSLTPSGGGFTESVVYKFKGGSDGQFPLAGLVLGADGNLYGTTSYGGTGSCGSIGIGCGTVFKLTPSGTETVLYSFQGAHGGTHDGYLPTGSLITDSNGDLFGTTAFGGDNCGTLTCGTAFEMIKSGASYSEQIIYRFLGASSNDGATPEASLVSDSSGALYGTTWAGGTSTCSGGGNQPSGCGTIFKLTPAASSGYSEAILANLMPGLASQPRFPSNLTDVSGTLYGTTSSGGSCSDSDFPNGCGTIFSTSASAEIRPASITILRSFQGPSDGADPGGGSFIGSNLRLNQTHRHWTGLRGIHELPPTVGGGAPGGGIINDGTGTLYGETSAGGSGGCLDPQYGCGTAYSFSTASLGIHRIRR